MVSKDILHEQLSKTLVETSLKGIGDMMRGKVRDSYVGSGKRYIVTTDRISAFDRVLGTLPFKGRC